MNRGEHLNLSGLQEIVNIRASINLGLSDVLKTSFSNSNFTKYLTLLLFLLFLLFYCFY